MKSYREKPIEKIVSQVTKTLDFANLTFWTRRRGSSKENFLILSLKNGFRVALRPSGTEPSLNFISLESESNPEDLSATKINIKRSRGIGRIYERRLKTSCGIKGN